MFQLCLLAKNFKPALQFMDVDITDISKEVYVMFRYDVILWYI